MRLLLAVALCGLAFSLPGCRRGPSDYWPKGAREELDALYLRYLRGDRSAATDALRESIALLEGLDARAQGRAHGLWFAYSRLFTLEQHYGELRNAAEHYNIATNWYRIRLELRGEASAAVAAALATQTQDRISSMVRQYDEAQTEGKGAHYSSSGK